ncbi:AraC family transcriptional regulator, partial [bacterium]|nr:AraC family transcriptional regulator [bacterium]
MSQIIHIQSISQVHQLLNLPEPKHPLITFYEDCKADFAAEYEGQKFSSELYTIFFKNGDEGSIGYGRNTYDFENSTLVFVAPAQVIEMPNPQYVKNCKGWTLMFHPDLIRGSHLGKQIDNYSFFAYEANEALHLSAQERADIEEIIAKIVREYSQNIDRHSQTLIVSNLELLLNYCLRFYDRQFYTRTNFNKDFVV